MEWREERLPAQGVVGSGEGTAPCMGLQGTWSPWAATGGLGWGHWSGPVCLALSPDLPAFTLLPAGPKDLLCLGNRL